MSANADDEILISRRDVMQGAAAGVVGGSALAIGVDRARAVAPIIPAGAAAAKPVASSLIAGGFGASAGYALANYLGDKGDYSGYTGADALHAAVEEGALELARSQEEVVSSLENLVEFVENAIIPKGMAEMVEALNDGADASTAKDRLRQPINEHVAGIQADLIDNYEGNIKQFYHYATQIEEHDNLAVSDIVSGTTSDGSYYFDSTSTVYNLVIELADGSQHDVEVPTFGRSTRSDEQILLPQWMEDRIVTSESDDLPELLRYEIGRIDRFETADGESSTIDVLDVTRYTTAADELAAQRTNIINQLENTVDETYAEYEAGEIDLSDYIDPTTAYTELRNDTDEWAFSGAAASMLGVPRNDQPMEIYLEDSEGEVVGSIYSTDSPDGGFEVGTRYDPSQLSYPVFMRYESVGEVDGETQVETDFIELQEPFEIRSAENEDGESVDAVDVEPGPEYDPSDIQSIQEQLEQIREEQVRLQQQAQSGGGGLLGDLGLGVDAGPLAIGVGIVAAASSGVALLTRR